MNSSQRNKIKLKKTFLGLIIGFIKFLVAGGSFIFKLLLILKKPSRLAARFVFYKIAVKIYCHYFSLIKKLGWNRYKKGIFVFIFNEKIVHVAIVTITFVIVLTNLIPLTSAKAGPERQQGSIVYNLVQSEFGEFEQEELIIEESLDKGSLGAHINIERHYLDNTLALRTEPSLEPQATFDDRMEYQEQALSQLPEDEEAPKDRDEIVEYVVKPGDTVGGIASKFGISSNTVLWENDLSAYDLIRAGDKLTILPETGVRHEVTRGESLSVITNKYDVDKDKIVRANNIESEDRLSIGDKLIIPGGRKQETSRSTQPSQQQSYSAISAVRDAVTTPQEEAPRTVSSKLHWPTTGHRITQYYSWRHRGLDVADPIGTPLFAAESGTIEFVGWSRGYGNNIIINHGGGKKTRYAHMNRFYVGQGQRVSRGETIGEMGNTGWSTGPHLHFEVIINGVKQNPLDYLR